MHVSHVTIEAALMSSLTAAPSEFIFISPPIDKEYITHKDVEDRQHVSLSPYRRDCVATCTSALGSAGSQVRLSECIEEPLCSTLIKLFFNREECTLCFDNQVSNFIRNRNPGR